MGEKHTPKKKGAVKLIISCNMEHSKMEGSDGGWAMRVKPMRGHYVKRWRVVFSVGNTITPLIPLRSSLSLSLRRDP
nr:hypothetical protein CFP56_35383 [Quercus suber]